MPSRPLPQGVRWFMMTVTLTIHESLGNVSAQAVDRGVRLLPQGVCGFSEHESDQRRGRVGQRR